MTIKNACGTKYKDCECCLEYTSIIDDLVEYKDLLAIRTTKTKKCLMKT